MELSKWNKLERRGSAKNPKSKSEIKIEL